MDISGPKHVALMEATNRNMDACREVLQQGVLARRETKQRKMMTRDSSGRQIAYKDYIAQAWGRISKSQESVQPTDICLQHSRTSSAPDEYISQLANRERRPKIQVKIPQRRSSTEQLIRKPTSTGTSRSKEDTPSSVSPPSTTTRAYEIAPARLSIVSPLSVVEMPKPRRPFSTNSIENMSRNMPSSAPPTQTDICESLDSLPDFSENASKYSRTSISTLGSENGMTKAFARTRAQAAFSVCSPSAAGVFDASPAEEKVTQPVRSLTVIDDAVKNKPLPPDPSVEEVAPLAIASSSSMRRRNGPAPLKITRMSTLPSTRLSVVSSLRSKYSPEDLDKLDEVFHRTSPLKLQPAHVQSPSLALQQAESELEAHLGIIAEIPSMPALPTLQDPLQIKRGPGVMAPSRPAPSPPDSASSLKKKFPRRAASHIVSLIRSNDDNARTRIAGIGTIAKAQKILGAQPEMAMRRQGSRDSHWSSSESRTPPNSSPNASTRGDTTTPETDLSSISDQTYEEVKARLDLLSPNREVPIAYLAIHEALESPAALKPDVSYDPSKQAASCATEITDLIVAPLRIQSPSSSGDRTTVEATNTHGRSNAKFTRSLASIAASEIPDLYAALPSPVPSLPPLPHQRNKLTAEEMEEEISADAAENVLLRILENIDNLQDLFSAATVSRGFYRTFKRHELTLMKNALLGMSAAAWELREMSPPSASENKLSPSAGYTPTTYLQDYMRDMYTMIALKSMILIHCESFLRAETIKALGGGETDRAAEIDDAFWRIWTFCKLFGHGTSKEDDIANQMDWLRGGLVETERQELGSTVFRPGFGRGNNEGLSAEALYDMTEIWTCLGVLVRGLQSKRHLARDVGIFDNSDVTSGDIEEEDAVLEEWTYHILTRAPPAVLDVTGPSSPTATTFALARSRGYTQWTPPSLGVSRSTFLKEAVSRVYQERMNARRYPSIETTSPVYSSPVSPQVPMSPETTYASRQRIATHAAQIRHARLDPSFHRLPSSEERPMSTCTDVFERLDVRSSFAVPQTRQSQMQASAPGRLYIPPNNHHVPRGPQELSIRPPLSTSSSYSGPSGPQVRDPVDVAIDRLVAMGFDEKRSKKALADTDNGNGIDFDEAVEVLVRERKRSVNNMMHWGYRGRKEPSVPDPTLAGDTLIGLGAIGRSASGGPPVRYD